MADPHALQISRLTKAWLPVILWAAVIFVFSSGLFSGAHTGGVFAPLMRYFFPGISPQSLEFAHFGVRKLGHLTEYFIFALLLMRALRRDAPQRSERSRFLFAFVLATLYAISDEFHQSFVPDRSASLGDVLIDMCGGIAGLFCSHALNRGKQPRRQGR